MGGGGEGKDGSYFNLATYQKKKKKKKKNVWGKYIRIGFAQKTCWALESGVCVSVCVCVCVCVCHVCSCMGGACGEAF